ncbi:hypothetical protein U732_3080 [Clostridium argentinense CDC 2741]|uniref:Knr4/Smi1-like domain-containing protein n=1 Tax=Clostridium argentinense CDC 2741 TaxID=1418104 RepID=A0A0C1R298_9CLOT|nr:SMI1/KNR4 family protein [Clostridium argentinense]ARC84678.1 1,3-beta-glucan synthase regulator [Clostridium argentinense]KIE47577.1 hypothetical protein U732_3080 [Clostridium argentinense CDC 2741]NFF40187.1 SMI1/KNR4 family protein [Clostridium argentinense]NFP50611.1 SMI1/KNR4 family protein [Clostridium argentinense]NFP72441.1 SMI1/KNR4 family protein [Clostridium argentinense]
MSILKQLSNRFSLDVVKEAAAKEDIELLKIKSSIEIPEEYIEIVKENIELEICVDGEVYIRIWGPKGCNELNEAYNIQKYLPESLAIGDDEGGGALMYLYGNEEFGIYLCRFGDLDIDEAIKISPSLKELLINNVGIDVLTA